MEKDFGYIRRFYALVISVSLNLNAAVCNEIQENCMLRIFLLKFGQVPFLFQHDTALVHKARFNKKSLIQSGEPDRFA